MQTTGANRPGSSSRRSSPRRGHLCSFTRRRWKFGRSSLVYQKETALRPRWTSRRADRRAVRVVGRRSGGRPETRVGDDVLSFLLFASCTDSLGEMLVPTRRRSEVSADAPGEQRERGPRTREGPPLSADPSDFAFHPTIAPPLPSPPLPTTTISYPDRSVTPFARPHLQVVFTQPPIPSHARSLEVNTGPLDVVVRCPSPAQELADGPSLQQADQRPLQ